MGKLVLDQREDLGIAACFEKLLGIAQLTLMRKANEFLLKSVVMDERKLRLTSLTYASAAKAMTLDPQSDQLNPTCCGCSSSHMTHAKPE